MRPIANVALVIESCGGSGQGPNAHAPSATLAAEEGEHHDLPRRECAAFRPSAGAAPRELEERVYAPYPMDHAKRSLVVRIHKLCGPVLSASLVVFAEDKRATIARACARSMATSCCVAGAALSAELPEWHGMGSIPIDLLLK